MKILHVSDLHYRESAENNALLKDAARYFEDLHYRQHFGDMLQARTSKGRGSVKRTREKTSS